MIKLSSDSQLVYGVAIYSGSGSLTAARMNPGRGSENAANDMGLGDGFAGNCDFLPHKQLVRPN